MNDLKEHSVFIERVAMLVYAIALLILLVVYRDWVLSVLVGVLTAIINFRIQIKGLKAFAEGGNALIVTGNFFLRLAIIAAVLFMAFSNPRFNAYVVFAFMFSFQFFVVFLGIFKRK